MILLVSIDKYSPIEVCSSSLGSYSKKLSSSILSAVWIHTEDAARVWCCGSAFDDVVFPKLLQHWCGYQFQLMWLLLDAVAVGTPFTATGSPLSTKIGVKAAIHPVWLLGQYFWSWNKDLFAPAAGSSILPLILIVSTVPDDLAIIINESDTGIEHRSVRVFLWMLQWHHPKSDVEAILLGLMPELTSYPVPTASSPRWH